MDAPEAPRLDRAIAAAQHALELDPANAAAWHDLGVLYQQRGALADSLTALERSVALDGSLASSHNNLGNTYQRLGEIERAVASYRRSLACDPALAAAHTNAAGALHLLGRNDEAREHAQHAIRLGPQSIDARVTAAFIEGALAGDEGALAQLDALPADAADDPRVIAARAYVLLRLARYDEALRTAQRGLAQQPGSGVLLESLGCALRGVGRFEEAFAAFDRAFALGWDRAAMLVFKASGLLELGAFDAARTTLRQALAIAPEHATAWSALVEVEPVAAGDPMLATMERLLATAPLLRAVEPRSIMLFALGKAYHKSGDPPNAFRHFAAGNALKRRTIVYDVADDERFAGETVAFFSPAALQRLGGGGDASGAPIFVVGMPRSGTTLVEQILASHPDVYGAGELTFFDRAIADAGPDDVTAIGRRYLELLATVAPAGKRIVDKLPSNFRHTGLIHLALPRARIVHCRRNPLDTCFSCYVTLFTGRQDFSFDLAETGRYYRAYARLMEHWQAVLPPGVMLDVQYEDLVADLETAARRLLAFCDLAWNEGVLRYYETLRPVRTASFRQVRQPIYATSVGAAHPYRAELGPLIDALTGDDR